MSNFYCGCKNNCVGLGIFSAIIIGIITAFLTVTATITVTPAFLWVLLGIAVGYLAVTLITTSASENNCRRCVCPILNVLLTGILGTVLTSIVLLGITFAATSIVGAIITGLLLAFFFLVIIMTACLIRCLADCDNFS